MGTNRGSAPGGALGIYATTALLTGGIFLLDLLTPLGQAAWLLYFIPLLVVSRVKKSLAPLVFAAAATALIAAGFFYLASHPVAPRHRTDAANRVLASGALWVTAIVLIQRRRAEAALAESEARYRGIVEDQTELLCRWRPDGTLSFVNEAYCRYFGKRKEELLGERFLPLILEEDRKQWHLHQASLSREHPVADVEHRTVRPDGEVRWQRWVNRAIFDGEGRLVGIQSVGRDITDRKKAEEALRRLHADLERKVRERTAALQASNERLRETQRQQRALLDSIPDIAWLKDRESRLIAVNHPFGQACGHDPKDLPGKTDLDIWPRELAERYRADDRLVMESCRMKRVEEPLVDPQGRRSWIETIKVPILEDGGRVIGTAGIARDITERKRAEEELGQYRERLEAMVEERTAALAESEERFRTLVAHALVGFFIVQEGRIVFLNPEAETLFGAVPEGFAVERLVDNLHPEDLPRFAAFLMAAQGGEERAQETEFRFAPHGPGGMGRDPGGGRFHRWVHCRTAPVSWRGRGAVLVNMVDITRVKEMERIALVQEKMASLGHVAAGIAHEIRNPLSGLNLYLDAAEGMVAGTDGISEDTKAAAMDVLSRMKSISEKIGGIVRSVMEFARPAPLRLGVVDVGEAVREAVQLAAVTLRKRGVSLEVMHPAEPFRCRADLRLLEQVVLNLLTNAAQAMEGQDGEKRIAIGCAEENGCVLITVADSGPGVPEAIREKVFDPFFTTRRGGTGIGLALSHRIVAEHGGFIAVGTSALGGAEFRVGIPAGGTEAGPASR